MGTVPSSFFSTRSTAPEQPPQDMLTLKTYLCSAPASGAVSTAPGVASTTSAIVSGGCGGWLCGLGSCCLASRCSELSLRSVVGGGGRRVGFLEEGSKRPLEIDAPW